MTEKKLQLTEKKLQHIAIIMDGNGRWARKKGLPISHGHKHGAEAARKTLIACLKLNIPYLTLYTFSTENWMRGQDEVNGLIELLRWYLTNEVDLLMKHNVRIKIIGQREKFATDVQELILKVEEKTKNNTALFLQLALSYGGREEIISANKRIISDVISSKINIDEIKEEKFASYLYANNIPDPDLLIRTSGEYRISNFLLWQLAYTELYFLKTLWPDFNSSHLKRAITNFYKRERRYGLSK